MLCLALVYRDGKYEKTQLEVNEESQLYIYANDKKIASMTASPFMLNELLVGYLYTEGYINSEQDIKDIRIDIKGDEFHLYSSIKKNAPRKENTGQISCSLHLDAHGLTSLVNNWQQTDSLYKKCGGIHSVALGIQDEILALGEDVGRYNSLDKLIGYCLLNKIKMNDKILIFSGRLSLGIIRKAYKSKAEILISRSAVTESVVNFARKSGQTLVGYARESGFIIYAHPKRIKE